MSGLQCACGQEAKVKGKCRRCYRNDWKRAHQRECAGYKRAYFIRTCTAQRNRTEQNSVLTTLCEAFHCSAVDLARYIMLLPGHGAPRVPRHGGRYHR